MVRLRDILRVSYSGVIMIYIISFYEVVDDVSGVCGGAVGVVVVLDLWYK